MNIQLNRKTIALAAALAVLAIPIVAAAGGSNAANKTSAAGSTIEILGEEIADGVGSVSATVLSTTIKTSPPQDLLFSVSLECALWTTVETVGNDDQASTARVLVTVLFDGVEVPVSSGDSDGSVVFCDRVHQQTTTLFDDENATIRQYLATRSANAFNWVLPDVGGGVHTVEVVAELSGEATDNALSRAGVGHRTLVVEPIHMAQGATVDDGSDAGDASAAAESFSAVDEGSGESGGLVGLIRQLFGL